MFTNKQGAILVIPIIIFCLMISGSLCQGSAVENDDYSRGSLSGLQGVYVATRSLEPEIEKRGLSASAIKTDAELMLRIAGINVLTKEQWIKTKGGPVFYIEIDIIDGSIITNALDHNLYAFRISVEFNQDVFLVRNPAMRVLSPTWSTSYLGVTNSLPRIRSKVKKMVQRFIDAFQEVNRQ
ncbi:MAG: hypothetical protein JRF24_04820 [Deltaproteobacteria bacterium]|nr:hypothetical protein [Deltaproteobacteria bacterium]